MRSWRTKNTIVNFLGMLGWSRNSFAQFPHMWPLLWQIAPSHGSSASSCTITPVKAGQRCQEFIYLIPPWFVQPHPASHLRNSAGRAIRLSTPWTGWLARCSWQGGERRRAQLCRCPPWDGLALPEWSQPAASWHIPPQQCALGCC